MVIEQLMTGVIKGAGQLLGEELKEVREYDKQVKKDTMRDAHQSIERNDNIAWVLGTCGTCKHTVAVYTTNSASVQWCVETRELSATIKTFSCILCLREYTAKRGHSFFRRNWDHLRGRKCNGVITPCTQEKYSAHTAARKCIWTNILTELEGNLKSNIVKDPTPNQVAMDQIISMHIAICDMQLNIARAERLERPDHGGMKTLEKGMKEAFQKRKKSIMSVGHRSLLHDEMTRMQKEIEGKFHEDANIIDWRPQRDRLWFTLEKVFNASIVYQNDALMKNLVLSNGIYNLLTQALPQSLHPTKWMVVNLKETYTKCKDNADKPMNIEIALKCRREIVARQCMIINGQNTLPKEFVQLSYPSEILNETGEILKALFSGPQAVLHISPHTCEYKTMVLELSESPPTNYDTTGIDTKFQTIITPIVQQAPTTTVEQPYNPIDYYWARVSWNKESGLLYTVPALQPAKECYDTKKLNLKTKTLYSDDLSSENAFDCSSTLVGEDCYKGHIVSSWSQMLEKKMGNCNCWVGLLGNKKSSYKDGIANANFLALPIPVLDLLIKKGLVKANTYDQKIAQFNYYCEDVDSNTNIDYLVGAIAQSWMSFANVGSGPVLLKHESNA